jgi:hypothetical protein
MTIEQIESAYQEVRQKYIELQVSVKHSDNYHNNQVRSQIISHIYELLINSPRKIYQWGVCDKEIHTLASKLKDGRVNKKNLPKKTKFLDDMLTDEIGKKIFKRIKQLHPNALKGYIPTKKDNLE